MKIPYNLIALFAATMSLPQLSAQTLSTASISGSDTTIYTPDISGELSVTPGAALTSVLQGTASSAGGNVELFASSDSAVNPASGGVFATATPTVLTAGFDNSQSVSVRSLNGADWFTTTGGGYDTTYGQLNLANSWYGDFVTAVTAQSATAGGVLASDLEGFFNTFRDNGGFAQISDPNVSYVQLSGNQVTVGLGGFLDASNRIAELLDVDAATFSSYFADGLQVSEVAIVEGDALYAFSAVDSGVFLDDAADSPGVRSDSDSYTGTYEVTTTAVPEPSSALLVLLGTVSMAMRRKR
ncbi:MAG: NF038130 family PEP-CTERM protein [Luteolibacter sp.]